jgi:hexosaminidase
MPILLRILSGVAAVAASVAAAAIAVATPAPSLPLVPMPALVQAQSGQFRVTGSCLHADPADRGAGAALTRFQDLLKRSGGPDLKRATDGRGGISFVRDAAVRGDEAYRLDVTDKGVTVAASGDAGLFYGAETLWQLAASSTGDRIAAVHIEDRPGFSWRGMMLDSARHFQPVDYIEHQLDRMALAKLNVFHWHLTDDQGWRLQIDGYPRLTQVGAWRTEAVTGKRYGGFYTKADVRRVVAYAAARHIMVVPEIEMPGHATALVASYPALASIANPPTAPTGDWGVLPYLLKPDDNAFAFMKTVLDEVMALFPAPFVHVGGDEAPKDEWKTSSAIQSQMKALGLADENALQNWFVARIGAYLSAHHRRMIGWDEILQGKVPDDAVVMSWHGIDGAIAAARAGHDAILAPAPVAYLDYRQSDAADETPGRGEIVDWRRLYSLDPRPASLSAQERSHILGLQSNLFTEHAPNTDDAERMTWPRAAVAAELAWSSSADRSWDEFAPRLLAMLDQWDRLGWTYDHVPLAPEMHIEGLQINVSQPAQIGTLHFTTDGAQPGPASPTFSSSLPWTGPIKLAARSFLGDRPVGPARHWMIDASRLRTRTADELTMCDNKLPMRLVGSGPEDGARPIHWVDPMAACWRWPAAPVDGAVTVSVEVAHLPFDFALGDALASVAFHKPETVNGELQIREGTCDGPRIATLPLPAATGPYQRDIRLTGRITPTTPGPHDLCMSFSQHGPDPLWVLDHITLEKQP